MCTTVFFCLIHEAESRDEKMDVLNSGWLFSFLVSVATSITANWCLPHMRDFLEFFLILFLKHLFEIGGKKTLIVLSGCLDQGLKH